MHQRGEGHRLRRGGRPGGVLRVHRYPSSLRCLSRLCSLTVPLFLLGAPPPQVQICPSAPPTYPYPGSCNSSGPYPGYPAVPPSVPGACQPGQPAACPCVPPPPGHHPPGHHPPGHHPPGHHPPGHHPPGHHPPGHHSPGHHRRGHHHHEHPPPGVPGCPPAHPGCHQKHHKKHKKKHSKSHKHCSGKVRVWWLLLPQALCCGPLHPVRVPLCLTAAGMSSWAANGFLFCFGFVFNWRLPFVL